MEVKTFLCKIVRCVALISVIIASVFITLAVLKDFKVFDINHEDNKQHYTLTDAEKLFILDTFKSD